MSTFKIGQKVVCISNYWKKDTGPIQEPTPKENEVCIISDMEYDEDGCFLTLKGYKKTDIFHSSAFKPLLYDKSAISELVNIKHITETSDQPMTNPSPLQPLKHLTHN